MFSRKRKRRVGPRTNARRSLDETGADGQVTRNRWARWGRRVLKTVYAIGVVGLLAAGCVGLFVLAREVGPLTRGWFAVRQVTIEGLDHVPRREVLSRLGFKDDTTLYTLNPNWLAERLKQHPWIKDATVTLVPFHEVRVVLTERIPSAVVRTPAENLLTDDEGYILARLGTKDEPTLPMLSGVDGRSLLQGKDGNPASREDRDRTRAHDRARGGRTGRRSMSDICRIWWPPYKGVRFSSAHRPWINSGVGS